MSWTRMKIAVVIGVCALLIGTAILIKISSADRFIQNMPQNWSVLSGHNNAWNWSHGKITVHDDFGEAMLVSGKDYGDFTLSADVTASSREASFVIRVKDAEDCYLIAFTPEGTSWAEHSRPHIRLVKQASGGGTVLASFGGEKFKAFGNKVKMEITARGSTISVRLNGVKVLTASDESYPTGRIGFRVAGNGRYPSDATYSDVSIQPSISTPN